MASKKHYPVQRKIRLAAALPSTATDSSVLVDREMSKVNHRLYRQSRYYSCKVDIDADLPNGTVVNVYALKDTWMNQKAYQFAHKMYLENTKEERSTVAAGTKARWNDFRVASGSSLSGPTLDATGYEPGGGPTRFTGGEYLFTEMTDDSGAAKTLRWFGTGSGTFNIVDEYDVTGNTNNEPSTTTGTAGYQGLNDEHQANAMDEVTNNGNAPPYDGTTIENQCWIHVATLFVDGDGGGRLSSGFFTVPCGLLTLTYGGGANQTVVNEKICLEVKSGDYKGVHAPSMLE